jgi:LPS-assembly lipoprotein
LSSSPLKLLALLLALSGCGFTPLYGGGDGGVAQQLDLVNVANIPERTGQMLRMSLQTQLHTAGEPAAELYSLAVSYSIAGTAIGIQEDSSATRTRYVANARWVLTPIGNPRAPLVQGAASTEDAANVIDQQYFAVTLENDTINQQLADEIAAQITAQVAAYFKAHPVRG